MYMYMYVYTLKESTLPDMCQGVRDTYVDFKTGTPLIIGLTHNLWS